MATALTQDLSDAFFTLGDAMGARLNLSFLHLLFCMNYESGIRANALNPNGKNVGLIQIGNLAGVGFPGSVSEFQSVSAEGQLPYVEAFLRPYAGKNLNSAARIHQALVGPATLDDPSGLIYSATGTRWGGKEPAYYAGNKSFDVNPTKGSITVDDLQRADVAAARPSAPNGPRFAEAIGRYSALTGQPLPLPAAPGSKVALWAGVALLAGSGGAVLLAESAKGWHSPPRRTRTA